MASTARRNHAKAPRTSPSGLGAVGVGAPRFSCVTALLSTGHDRRSRSGAARVLRPAVGAVVVTGSTVRRIGNWRVSGHSDHMRTRLTIRSSLRVFGFVAAAVIAALGWTGHLRTTGSPPNGLTLVIVGSFGTALCLGAMLDFRGWASSQIRDHYRWSQKWTRGYATWPWSNEQRYVSFHRFSGSVFGLVLCVAMLGSGVRRLAGWA
jgi:hypothetical protein